MQQKIFTIRDSKGEFFTPPFYQRSHGEAERTFKKLTEDDKSTLSKYPEDFDLYYIGEFDDLSGQIKALETPQHICKAINIRSQN